MRIVRLKQVELALADGRLDEACDLLADRDLRDHRRGQELVGELVPQLLDRGRKHLESGHARQALADCQKAQALAGNAAEIAELQAQVAERLAGRQGSKRRRGELAAAAREHIENGRLSLGEALLADAPDHSGRTELLRHEAEARRKAAGAALQRAEAALERSDHATAIDELLTARANRADTDAMAELAGRLIAAAAAEARQEIGRGRGDLAEALLGRLAPLAAGNRELSDLLGILAECRRGRTCLDGAEFRQAAEALRRAAAMLPEAQWLQQAVADAERGAAAIEALRSGPLGMLPINPAEAAATQAPPPLPNIAAFAAPAGPATPAAAPRPASGAIMPSKFLLRLDGTSTTLVLRESCVTIGPISSSERPQLGLMADAGLPVATVQRTEGDYLLRSEQTVAVNDRPVTEHLLSDGDKIALSPRCRLRFRLPSAASGSAVLELSTARLPQADVRRIVLLDREMIVGPGSAVHVRSEDLPHRAVLHLRDGRLLCQSETTLTNDAGPLDPTAGLPLDTPVRLGPLGLVVTRV